MLERLQGPLKAVLMIAAVVVPVVALGYFGYYRYTTNRAEYLTRLNYLELGIAADQLASRVGGWRQFSAFQVGRMKLEAGGCAENVRRIIEDPVITCAPRPPLPTPAPRDPKEPSETPANVLVKDVSGTPYFYVDIPGRAGWWGYVPVATILDQLKVDGRRFDDVLLMTSDEWVIHGRTMSAVSLADAVTGATKLAAGTPGIADAGKPPTASRRLDALGVTPLRWQDQDQLAFIRPTGIRVPFWAPNATAPSNVELVLAGIVSRARFDAEKQRLAYRWILGAILLLVLGLLAWPLLAFRLIGPHERLAAIDVRLLAFALIGLAGLLPAVILAAAASADFGGDIDSQLPEIAARIRDRFEERLRVGLALLAPDQSGDNAYRPPSTTRVSIVGADGVVQNTYDVDPSGSWNELPSVGISVSDRSYFQALRRRSGAKLWTRDGKAFVSEVVRSKRQNVYKLIVAQERNGTRRRNGIVLANLDIDAFRDPVLPPGIDFAIIDRSGKVQLHSRNTRNTVENFYDALDDPAELRAAVDSGRTTTVTARYAGDEARFRIAPLPGTPWSLLVFRSAESVQTLVLESVGRFAVLFVIYVALAFACLLLFEGVTGRYRFGWVWPDRTVPVRLYVLVAVRSVVLALLLLVAWDGAAIVERVLLIGGIPLLGLLATGADLVHGRKLTSTTERRATVVLFLVAFAAVAWVGIVGIREGRLAGWYALGAAVVAAVPTWPLALGARPARTEAGFRTAYVTSMVALLALLSSMPATVLFEDAHVQVYDELLQTLRDRFPAVDGEPAQNVYTTSLARTGDRGFYEVESVETPTRRLSALVAHLLPVYSATAAEVRQRRGPVPPWNILLGTAVLVLAALAATSVAVVTLLGVIRGMFHLEADPIDDGAAPAPTTSGGTAVVVYRLAGTALQGDAAKRERATLDLRVIRDPQAVGQWWTAKRGTSCQFVLGHLESRLHDPPWHDAVLAVLEEAIFDSKCTVIVTSSIEPYDYVRAGAALERRPASGAPDGPQPFTKLVGRWSLVLSMLVKDQYILPLTADGPPDEEIRMALAAYRGAASAASDDAMEGAYRELWRVLGRDEQLALRQLAEEGFVSPAAADTVRSLMRRRLVRREPMLTVVPEGFSRFVRRAERPETIEEWERGDLGGMELFARFLPAALLGGLVLVFATQREVFNATTTLIATAGTAVPALLKLLSSAGKDGGSATV